MRLCIVGPEEVGGVFITANQLYEMKTQDILKIMHSPKYFVGVEMPRKPDIFKESERHYLELVAAGVREQATSESITEHLWLLEGTETPQEAAGKILHYLVGAEDGLITLEKK